MRKVVFLVVATLTISASAQQTEPDLQAFAEELFQLQDLDVSYEDLYESLLQFYTNKLNLNEATPEELGTLFLLTPLQVTNFFAYRDRFGSLLSIHELQAIPDFDLTTIRKIKPFISVEEKMVADRPFLKRILSEENNYLLLRYTRRLETPRGFEPAKADTTIRPSSEKTDTLINKPSRYAGPPHKIYGRFRVTRRNDFSLGFTFEQDPGETFSLNRSDPGFDFQSYHLLVENNWGFRKIILGDFQMQAGQGLVFGAGFTPGKGSETITTVKRNTLGIRPYTSVLETGFFRGAGLSKELGPLRVTIFFSTLQQDGAIQSDTTRSAFESFVNSIQSSGLHRTPTERSAKDQITENNVGALLHYAPNPRSSLGFSSLFTAFSQPISRRPNAYNQFEFAGKANAIQSLFGHYTWQNFTFFGEFARSKSGGTGLVGGLIASLSGQLSLSLLGRNYERNFHSFYGNAFSEGSRAINESGIYWGMEYKPSRRHRFSLYYDLFRFPWLRFRTESPSNGSEWLVRYTFEPSRNIIMFATIRNQRRGITIPNEKLQKLVMQNRYNYNFHVNYRATPAFLFKTRIQGSRQWESLESSAGFALAQDVELRKGRFQIYASLAVFETDNFDNAQYFYERDVLYAFSIPAYSGKGTRTYVMIRFDPTRSISLWSRFARFYFPEEKSIGSGLEEIQGNRRSEIKIMARIRF